MNKPIKPKKPQLNDKKPSKELFVQKWICIDDGNQVFLRPVELDEYGYRKEYRKNDLFANSIIDYYHLERLNEMLGHGFGMHSDCDHDGYFNGWVVSWTGDNPNYDKELDDYEKRFDRYSHNLKSYEDEMILYNIWRKEQEIEKLKEKIKKKEKEIGK